MQSAMLILDVFCAQRQEASIKNTKSKKLDFIADFNSIKRLKGKNLDV